MGYWRVPAQEVAVKAHMQKQLLNCYPSLGRDAVKGVARALGTTNGSMCPGIELP